MMILTAKLCIASLSDLTLIQGRRTVSLTKFSMDLDENWYSVETCLSYNLYADFVSSDEYSTERTQLK